MKRLIMAIALGIFCWPLLAAESPLFGKWFMSSSQGTMVIAFSETEMTMASSLDLKKNAQTVKVRYKQLDKAWGIEMLGANGAVQGSMMAILLSEDLIRFGAPGASFFELRRVR